MARWQANFVESVGKIHLGSSWRHWRRYYCQKGEKVLEWNGLSYDRTGVSTRSICVELEVVMEETRSSWGLPEGVAFQMTRHLIWGFPRSQDVCSSLALVKTSRRLPIPTVLTLWLRSLPMRFFILFSHISRAEWLTSEELCGSPLEASGGGVVL